jgi:FtsH-binding integral membrane protein
MIDWLIGRGIVPLVGISIALIIVGYIAFKIVNSIENWITLIITVLVIILCTATAWAVRDTLSQFTSIVVLGVFGQSIYQRLLRR